MRNGYFVLGSFLKRTKGLREDIRLLQVGTVSLLLAELHPDKNTPLS